MTYNKSTLLTHSIKHIVSQQKTKPVKLFKIQIMSQTIERFSYYILIQHDITSIVFTKNNLNISFISTLNKVQHYQ